MERTLFLVAAVVAAATWAAGSGPPDREGAPPVSAARRLLPLLPGVVGFLLCLPVAAPFASGLALGWGLLIGAVAATFALARGGADGPAAAAPAVAASVLPFFLLRGGLLDALDGVALGWVSGVVCAGVAGGRVPVVAALAGAIVPVAAQLGVLRTGDLPALPRDSWCLAPLAVPAAVGAVRALGRRTPGPEILWKGLAVVGAGLALWLATRRVGAGAVVPGVGLAGVLLWGLVRAALGDGASGARRIVAALAVLAAELVAAHLLNNFGPGLLAVGMLAGALILPPNAGGAGPLALAAALALIRLTGVVWATELRGLGLGEQLALGGALLGALLPAAADELARREARPWLAVPLVGALLVGATSAALLVYGFGALLPVLVGIALACAGAAAPRRADRVSLAALALGLLLLSAAHPIETLSEKTRKDRLRAAVVLVAVPAVLAALAEATRRRAPRRAAS